MLQETITETPKQLKILYFSFPMKIYVSEAATENSSRKKMFLKLDKILEKYQ